MNSPEPPDPLDHLLDLTDPCLESTAVRRLHGLYRAERTRARQRRRLFSFAAGAVAAAVAVILLTAEVLLPSGGRHITADNDGTHSSLSSRNTGALAGVARLEREPSRSPGEDFASSRPRRPTLAEKLALLASAPPAHPKRAAASAALPADPRIEELFAALRSPLVENRLAAAEQLGRRADGPTVDRLIALTSAPATCREAALALLASDDPKAKAFVGSREARPLLALIQCLDQPAKRPQSFVIPLSPRTVSL